MTFLFTRKTKHKLTHLCFLFFIINSTTISAENTPPSSYEEYEQSFLNTLCEKGFYVGTGTVLESVSLLAKISSKISSSTTNECIFLSDLCKSASSHFFSQASQKTILHQNSFLKKNIPISQSSWYAYQLQLAQIPADSEEEKKLLLFLENRWLAKSTGFFPSLIDWIYPCFGISVQVHPKTTASYARSPLIKLSQTYKNRVEIWKESLPHPVEFPLILTRPSNLQNYLPFYFKILKQEEIYTIIKQASFLKTESKIVIDLTLLFSNEIKNSKDWMNTWNIYKSAFSSACKKFNVDLNQIICIEILKQEEVGGIRILPLFSTKKTEEQHQFLLAWISTFGLSANRVELDRLPLTSFQKVQDASFPKFKPLSKEKFLSSLGFFDQNWKSTHFQKNFMIEGVLLSIKGLLNTLSESQWQDITNNPTFQLILELSFSKIEEELNLLLQKQDSSSFFEVASHLEQIHANLSALLAVLSPYTEKDFPVIYQNLLKSIPKHLKDHTSYALHSSAMTSIAGIFQATQRSLGRNPRILYGENTYYECINAAKSISKASSLQEATEEDFQEVDLILAQFNPVWKGTNLQKTEYKVENISKALHNAFSNREKPLTLAIDCTFDFIDSSRVGQLLKEFQGEIQEGHLNVICYRSGLKFDLFGMDNYCGAPFYMIHNQDSKWNSFNALLTDPVLQTDRLSLNWFCLAYKYSAVQLEMYRKQIFDNTKSLLKQVPSSFFASKNTHYRIIPIQQDVDPAFIDITITGPLHSLKAAILSGYLSFKSMEKAFPIFYRISIGLYHSNLTMLFDKECSTIRLSLGLDPDQVKLLADCLNAVDDLNGFSEIKDAF